ncbi:transcription antitermination factor NusB [Crassaminicella thermophila]|uniref:Transcription antitermination protein NusB n=1 Tax=Crassaminicella thermophila TaxID=2599308 RepID=A0A5C0SD42_CRATE|nr:transcription antitermination factor NusB [Crassaminicella thermophila]QEK12151.1 transcription antitermination factor NusB [Crassaminicella thermophila]
MNRKLAREMTMKLIFQMDIHDDFSNEMITRYIQELPDDSQISYIKELIEKFIKNKDKIDGIIEENSRGWKLNRIAKVDLTILRLAITEIYYMDDIPNSVSINEAVEMAKTFSTEESSSFINGILGSIVEKK